MANLIRFKRGLKGDLPSLATGEPGFCTDTEEFFIGNTGGNVGIVDWNSVERINFLTYYVDAVNGSDSNSGASSGNAFKTIAKAVSMIRGLSSQRVEIILLPGVYDEDVQIAKKIRCQTIILRGETTDASLYQVKSIEINEILNRVGIENLTVTTGSDFGIEVVYCNRTSINNVVVTGSSTTHGLYVYDACCRVSNSVFSNKNIGIASDVRSWVHIENCTGTSNQVGIYAGSGSIITVSGTVPNGTTRHQSPLGGQIFGLSPFAFFRSGGMSLPASSSVVDIPITTVVEDSYGVQSGNSIIVPMDGWYHINMLLTLQSLPAGNMADLSILKNGSQLTNREVIGFGTAYVTYLTVDEQQYLVAGDVLTFRCFQDSSSAITAYNTQIRLTKIGQRKT